jgi:hypothetical protein
MGFAFRGIFMHNNIQSAKNNVSKALDGLKKAWDENPIAVISATGVLFAGASRLLAGISSIRNSRSWRQEVKRRQERDRSRRF